MGLLLTVIAGATIWIVLWAIDVKSLDAILIPLVMVIVVLALRIAKPLLPGHRD